MHLWRSPSPSQKRNQQPLEMSQSDKLLLCQGKGQVYLQGMYERNVQNYLVNKYLKRQNITKKAAEKIGVSQVGNCRDNT